jgi:hypothetical protein
MYHRHKLLDLISLLFLFKKKVQIGLRGLHALCVSVHPPFHQLCNWSYDMDPTFGRISGSLGRIIWSEFASKRITFLMASYLLFDSEDGGSKFLRNLIELLWLLNAIYSC